MATVVAGNTVKENLMFAYDTGHGVASNQGGTRHSPGEPTVNLLPSGPATGTGDFTRQGSHVEGFTYSKATNYKGRADVHKMYCNPTGNAADPYADFGGQYHKSGGSAVGDVYALSFDFYVSKGSNKPSLQLAYANGYKLPSSAQAASLSAVTDTYLGAGWTRRTTIATITIAGNTHWRFRLSTSGNETEAYLDNFQIELKSHATPFVDGTRSATQSLIDLKEATTINIPNLSFDSTGQPEFDGTDDVINTGMFTSRNPTYEPLTIEAIVKSDTTANARMWLDATNNGTNQRLYCALPSSTSSSSPMGVQASAWSISTPQNTDFHHIVITMNGTTCQLYLDGVAHSSKAYTSYGLQSINIGGRNGYRWIGKIPVVRMYRKALTIDEITQNYNVYKNRFNI